MVPADAVASTPLERLHVRHTVGLADPIRVADIAPAQRLEDGLPQALDEYIAVQGISYFKIKVQGDPEADRMRLRRIAALLDDRAPGYRVTLDGNEQYHDPSEFDALVAAIEADVRLSTLWSNTLVIEQPLERSIALDAAHTAGIRQLCRRKPVIST